MTDVLLPGQHEIKVCCMSTPPKPDQSCCIYTRKGKNMMFKSFSEFKESELVDHDDEVIGWWPMRFCEGGSTLKGMMPPIPPRRSVIK